MEELIGNVLGPHNAQQILGHKFYLMTELKEGVYQAVGYPVQLAIHTNLLKHVLILVLKIFLAKLFHQKVCAKVFVAIINMAIMILIYVLALVLMALMLIPKLIQKCV